MKTYKIFTGGKMSGLTYQEQMEWRTKLETLLHTKTSENTRFIHPPMFYSYDKDDHKSEKEVMEWELNQIRDSDILVVYLPTISDSIGSHIELGFAEAINQFGNKHIHVIGVGKPNVEHPWIDLITMRQEDTLDSAADYISTYLLV